MITKHATETNTLALIRKWSMAGAHGDLSGHFTSPVDIYATVAERHEGSVGDGAPPTSAPVMVKSAGEDDWLILAPNGA